MKDKWRHIRDRLVKHTNQGKSGDPAIKKKKYIYADALSFLLQTLDKRQTSGNMEEDTDVQENQNEGRSVEEDADEEIFAASVPSKVPRGENRQRSKATLSHFQTELLKQLSSTSKQEEEDPDKSFLLSILPDLKELDANEKLEFKMHNLQFFQNIRQKRKNQSLQPAQPRQYTTVPYFSPEQSVGNSSQNTETWIPMADKNMHVPSHKQGPLSALAPSYHVMQALSPDQAPSLAHDNSTIPTQYV